VTRLHPPIPPSRHSTSTDRQPDDDTMPRPPRDQGALSRLFVALTTLAVSLFLSLCAAEILVRMVSPQPRLVIEPGGFYSPDPPGRYRLSPGYRGRIYNRAEYSNAIRINEAGLRGPEIEKSAEGSLRVLVVGDSFVFGVGVEDNETFTALLPVDLSRAGIEAEGLNAGIPAFGIPDAESWLRRHGAELNPDVVVVAVFLGNDLVDASPDREEILLVDGLLVPSQSAGGLKAWLHRHSHLYVAIKGLFEQPGFQPLRSKLGLGEPWKVRTLREELGVYRKSADLDLKPSVDATDEALAGLRDLSSELGFELLAVLIPSEIQLDPKRWQGSLARLGLDPAAYDPTTPTRIFERLLARHEIPTLDLGPAFAAGLSRGEELYFKFDRHWTVEGHQLAADELTRFMAPLLESGDEPAR